jgi:hypothetical protein
MGLEQDELAGGCSMVRGNPDWAKARSRRPACEHMFAAINGETFAGMLYKVEQ